MSCNHFYKVLDTVTADEICTECGKILGRLFNGTIDLPNSRFRNEYTSCYNENYIHFHDFVHNANLPEKYADTAYDYYSRLNISLDKVKIFACIYEALIFHNSSFSLFELSAYSGFPPKTLSKAHKKLFFSKPSGCNTPPSEMINRFCSKLIFTRKMTNEIYNLVKNVEENQNVTNKPSTICAAYIYKYCLDNYIKISLFNICKICGVSQTTVRRYVVKHIKNNLKK